MDLSQISTLLILIFQVVSGVRHVVYWDRVLTPELAEDGLVVTLEVNDWMDVLCPYVMEYDMRRHKDSEVFLHIFNVTEDEYINCDTTRGIRLQSCDDPVTEKKLTTKFQERSPYPFGFTFRAGSTYYYLSKPPHDRSRGCTDYTMRMAVNVNKKGSVFPEGGRKYTRTYHKSHNNREESWNNIPNPTLHKPVTSKKPDQHHRHHHHGHVTSTTASTPKSSARMKTPKLRPVHAGHAQKDKPDNGSQNPTSSILFLISTFICMLLREM